MTVHQSLRAPFRIADILAAATPLRKAADSAAATWLGELYDVTQSSLLLDGRLYAGRYVAAPGPRGGSWPALISVHKAWDDDLRAIEICYLAEDGSGLAPVAAPRLWLGPAQGHFCGLSWGQTARPLTDAREPEGVFVTQSVETGLAVMRARRDARVWVCARASNLSRLPFDLPQLRSIVHLRDRGRLIATDELRRVVVRTGKSLACHAAEDFLGAAA